MVTYGEATIVIRADASRVPRDIEQQARPQTQKAGLGLASALGAGLKRGAVVAGAAVAGILAYSITKGFQRLAAIDQARAKLTGLGHDAKTVEKVMKNALNSVRGTAFGLGDAASVAASTVAAGIKPGRELEKVLKLIADTATISGTSMRDVGAIFNKVAAQGKIQGDELAQMTERGIPAIQFLAKSLGITAGEVLDLVKAGEVSFPMFAKAMELGLGGAAKSSGTTFMGALANVQAALGRFGASLLTGVFSQMPALFQGSIGSIDKLTAKAEPLGEIIGRAFARAVGVIQQFFAEFKAGVGTAGALRTALAQVGSTIAAVASAGMTTVAFFREHETAARALGAAIAYLVIVNRAWAAANAATAAGGTAALLLSYVTKAREAAAATTLISGATKVWTSQIWLANAALTAQRLLLGAGSGMVSWLRNVRIATTLSTVWRNGLLAVGLAQVALNYAISANPIGLIVIAIAAFVAALVLAYRNSETFRKIVNAAWAGIQKAIGAAVGWIVDTAVPAMISAWNSVWKVLQTVGSWMINTFGPWFKTLNSIIEFVFKAIVITVKAAWVLGIKPALSALGSALKALGPVFTWLYDSIIKPVWKVIASYIKAQVTVLKVLWTGVLQPALKALGAAFSWLYNNAIKPAWSAIKSAASAAWSGMKPVFSAIKTGVAAVSTAFGHARDGIRTAWNALEGIAKRPIKFVIGTVLNKGLIKAFNWLGKRVGGPHIDPIPMPFAQGGVLPGYTPGRDVHRFFSPTAGVLDLSGGEAIMRPEFTRAMGGPAGIARINRLARAGRVQGDVGAIGGRAYAGGGVIDWIKQQGANAFNWMGDAGSAIWNAFKNPMDFLKSKMPKVTGVGGVVKDLANASAGKLLTSTVGKVKSMFSTFNKAFGAGGGPKFAKMRAWIMGHLGIPYLWGGTGPRYDCIAEGTLVATLRGDVPIENVTIEDWVLTRAGYRRVLRAWLVREDAPLTEIEVDGRWLRGTADHRVWTENRGWAALETITRYDTLVSCHAAKRSFSTGTLTSAIRTPLGLLTGPTSSGPETACIARSGASTTARSPRGTRCTTPTTTRTTTIRPTSYLSKLASTDERAQHPGDCATTSAPSAGQGSSRPLPIGTRRQDHSGSAAISTRTTSTTVAASRSATGSRLSANVYDLTVEGEHEFFAAGVLVHNCSGFTQAASRAGGVSIPRVARAQQAASMRIPSGVVRGGDLGFFGAPAHHVLMAMGNGRWAHAPHTGDVTRIASFAPGAFTNFGRTFARGGVVPTFDRGGILPPGVSAVRNATGRSEGLVPTDLLRGGDTYIEIKLSLDDLRQLKTLEEFLTMLERSRVNRRRTERSGSVTA
jgi:tape measure domain-containing protein